MSKKIFLGLIALMFGASLMAQEADMSDDKKLKIADRLMLEGSFYNAIDYYLDLWSRDTGNYDLKYKIGSSYYFSRNYLDAEPWFEKAVKLDPQAKTLAFYLYGECLRHNQKYDMAKEQYTAFKKVKYTGPDSKLYKKMASNHIGACDYALNNMKYPRSGFIENIGDDINSNYTDFSPTEINDSTFIFASLRSDSVLHVKPGETGFFPVKLFTSKRDGHIWSNPEPIGDHINLPYMHTANPAFSEDKMTMYFTHCKQYHGEVRCHIYKSNMEDDGHWSKPKRLHDHVNNHNYTSTQPTIGKLVTKKRKETIETTVMYFSSNRPGGKGGLDIWYSELKENGHFSRPKNAGRKINTIGDEISPYLVPNTDMMYFSSNYHHGFGGYDNFKTKGKGDRWGDVENVGYRLNSSLDDTYYTVDSTELHGYFVSNRPGGHALTSETCCDDIYHFDLSEQLPIPLKGFAYDNTIETKKPLNDVKVSLFIRDNEGNDSLVVEETYASKASNFDFPIEKNFQYVLKAEKDGYEGEEVVFATMNIRNNDTISMLIPMVPSKVDTVPTQEDTTIVASKETVEEEVKEEPKNETDVGFVLKSIYHGFDQAKHEDGSADNIDNVIRVMKENPFLKIRIESHTDSKGTDEYNQKLSEMRANSAKMYIIRQGISGSRVKTIGYGEQKPVAPNENADGSDNPEGRAKNRRTDFIVISNEEN